MKYPLMLTIVGVAACSSSVPEPVAEPPERCPPVEATVELSATARSNASPDGEGRPVQVRIYQLDSDAKLRSATFEDIWQRDQEFLQTDLKSVAEHTVFPGKTEVVSLKQNPEAHFLAIVALFREPQGKDWFVSYELEPQPQNPPCAEKATLPVVLDRMQIQDGDQTDESASSSEETADSAEGATDGTTGGS